MAEEDRRLTGTVSFCNVDEGSEGQRLDNFLVKQLKRVPKSKIYQIIRKGEVRVNKKRCKPATRLVSGDIVRIPPLRMSEESSKNSKISYKTAALLNDSVLFEDDGLLIINKPHGLAVHGGSGISQGVIEMLRQMRPESRFLELVHRIDRDTSGILMIAKKRRILVEMHSMLQTGRVTKSYLAWVDGKWPASKPVITAPLRKNSLKSGERMVVVAADGKPCETTVTTLLYLEGEKLAGEKLAGEKLAGGKIEVEKTNSGKKSKGSSYERGCTLINANPVTGRTHQIRVHCQFAGHPIIGDPKYCPPDINKAARDKGLNRMCLHAESVRLDWSDGHSQVIKAPWPLANSPFA